MSRFDDWLAVNHLFLEHHSAVEIARAAWTEAAIIDHNKIQHLEIRLEALNNNYSDLELRHKQAIHLLERCLRINNDLNDLKAAREFLDRVKNS